VALRVKCLVRFGALRVWNNQWDGSAVIRWCACFNTRTFTRFPPQCFEGMKAYKDREGKIRLFRPEKNMARLNHSMTRLAMPSFNGEGFLECLKALLQLDSSWIPDQEGYSMYIRPTAIGTSPYLGVEAAQHVKLYAILSPVGPYYRSGFKPVKLYADTVHTRAWPGGVGNAKVRQDVSLDSVCELITRLRRDSSAVNLSYSLPIDPQ
jgi:branched-subunit amino acid aminotransferase/4-amino-4-deoxychorismate lyase